MHKVKSYIRHKADKVRMSLWRQTFLPGNKEGDDFFPLRYVPQRHELEISRYFSRVNKGGASAISLAPVPLPTHKNVVMCFLNRSGSNLLAEALYATGQMGLADEFFNYDRVFERCGKRGIKSFGDYITSLTESDCHATKSGVFTTKLAWDQLYFLTKNGTIPNIIKSPRFVMVKRRDLVAQAVSFLVAHKTGEWKSSWKSNYGHERAAFEIDDEEIIDVISQLAFAETQFRKYFALFGIDPLVVHYEDLSDNVAEYVQMTLDYLELDGKGAVINPDLIKVKKQRSDKKQEITESFKERHSLVKPEAPNDCG